MVAAMRVVELGDRHQMAAAYAGRLLVALGEGVTRVDSVEPDLDAASDLYLNHGKERVVLAGSDLTALIAEADAVICDLPAARVAELRLDQRSDVPVISITPFGLDGPYRDWKATPATLLALGGYSHIIGDPDRAPLTLPGRYPEYAGGLYGLAALYALRHASRAAFVEVSLFETVVALHQYTVVDWTYMGEIRGRYLNRFANIAPVGMYPCADGWIGVAGLPPVWDALVALLDHDELNDGSFDDQNERWHRRDELDRIIREALVERTAGELETLGQFEHRVPIGAMRTMGDLLDDPHLRERGFWSRNVTADSCSVRLPRAPFVLTDADHTRPRDGQG